MPRIYKPKTDRKYKKTEKPQELPATFAPGFLSSLDKRTELARTLRANYDSIVADVGGMKDVGHVKNAIIERFVWLEAILQTIEHELVNGTTSKADALGRWVQAVNTLSGLAKVLGVERRASSSWAALDVTPDDGGSTDD